MSHGETVVVAVAAAATHEDAAADARREAAKRYTHERIRAITDDVAHETTFHPHMLQPQRQTESRGAVVAGGELRQRTDVRTWKDFFSYDSIPMWQATPHQLTNGFIHHASIDMQSYHDYLSSIDIDTGVRVYDATNELAGELKKCWFDAMKTDIVAEGGSEYDPIIQFAPGSIDTQFRVAKQWAAYRFTHGEVKRLLEKVQSAALRTNTLYLLPSWMCKHETQPGVQRLDVRAIAYHIDYRSVETFATSLVTALRRLSLIVHYSCAYFSERVSMINRTLVPIIQRAIDQWGDRHGGMRAFERTAVVIMQTLHEDAFVRDRSSEVTYYYARRQAKMEAYDALVKSHDDVHLRTAVFAARRVAHDDYFYVTGRYRMTAIMSFIGLVFTLTRIGHFAHPPLHPVPHVDPDDGDFDGDGDDHVRDVCYKAHHALVCLILSGADPATITCFVDNWNPLQNGRNLGPAFDDVDATRLAADGTFCLPLVWLVRQMPRWGDMNAAQMAALTTYLDHPFAHAMAETRHMSAGIELTQFIMRLPRTCNLYRAFMGDVDTVESTTMDRAAYHGTIGQSRIRELVFGALETTDMDLISPGIHTTAYTGSPFKYDGFSNEVIMHVNEFAPFLLDRMLEQHFWKKLFAQIPEVGAGSWLTIQSGVRNLLVAITSRPDLIIHLSPSDCQTLRANLRRHHLPALEQYHHSDRAITQALTNLDANYFSQYRALAVVAQSRLFTTRVTNQAPFSRGLPAEIVVHIMEFVARPAHVGSVSDDPIADIFAPVGLAFRAKLTLEPDADQPLKKQKRE